jgi:hypothetical protein
VELSMIAYASQTGTRRNLKTLANNGWRLFISAKGNLLHYGFPYALDNGAWWAYCNKQPFDTTAFLRAYERLAGNADFVVLPDIVAGGNASLAFSMAWRDRLPYRCPQLLAVQNGMTANQIGPLVGPNLGIFLGGTTDWKMKTMKQWGEVARSQSAYLHIGRVNSARRIALCAAYGAQSFDGSSASRYAKTMPLLENARRQMPLALYGHRSVPVNLGET